jgi:hypothetical protein
MKSFNQLNEEWEDRREGQYLEAMRLTELARQQCEEKCRQMSELVAANQDDDIELADYDEN